MEALIGLRVDVEWLVDGMSLVEVVFGHEFVVDDGVAWSDVRFYSFPEVDVPLFDLDVERLEGALVGLE